MKVFFSKSSINRMLDTSIEYSRFILKNEGMLPEYLDALNEYEMLKQKYEEIEQQLERLQYYICKKTLGIYQYIKMNKAVFLERLMKHERNEY
ncbi:hypothetical protein CA598_05920 [Paenibacillus sp. VTT E-133291]|nr:hypothetical protein CA598_05920 [Paenibacillus sp. VTT E-133291]